jgi:hypothetical protein
MTTDHPMGTKAINIDQLVYAAKKAGESFSLHYNAFADTWHFEYSNFISVSDTLDATVERAIRILKEEEAKP